MKDNLLIHGKCSLEALTSIVLKLNTNFGYFVQHTNHSFEDALKPLSGLASGRRYFKEITVYFYFTDMRVPPC